ncbi:class I SAM-dependent DNA methyltransferase [Nocardia beijingensis]|uniref:class I SAM-dependent DNA methyltransferase n=1 Tax=Nocardia beijingensis TaxID=95162 RepID=UPI001894ADDD|nr:class I SAM-dependent methyltransferase [Nocardia beijingensis]MBF6076886.1 class I SAM-dependent methyltransferase [Nocardia beijingensis]
MQPTDDHFGEQVAATYDESAAAMFAPSVVDPAVDFLAEAAGAGPALEFGVGTGRIALPLAARGVRVHGIDSAPAMVARLRAKPGGDTVGATVGDFASTALDSRFSLVYSVFNTIMNVTTQAGQVACFRNAAAHLRPGGRFVVEVMMPELRRLEPGGSTVLFRTGSSKWAYDDYDIATQTMNSNYIEVVEGRGSYRSVPFRYVWPAELDLMAEIAGLRLSERWGGWTREPFTSDSRGHVSVWEKPRS